MHASISFVIFLVLGAILSLPYCLLAGWDGGVFPVMVVATPFMLVLWIWAAAYAKIYDTARKRIYWKNAFRRSEKENSRAWLAVFWIWTVYILLPIIVHWAARLIGYFGGGRLAAFLETYRYDSLFYVLWLAGGVFLALQVYGGISRSRKT